MTVLRALLLVLLALSMLPWGSAVKAADALRAKEATVQSVMAEADPDVQLSAPGRHCRIGVLPGACHGGPLATAPLPARHDTAVARLSRVTAAWTGTDRRGAPPREPPRPA